MALVRSRSAFWMLVASPRLIVMAVIVAPIIIVRCIIIVFGVFMTIKCISWSSMLLRSSRRCVWITLITITSCIVWSTVTKALWVARAVVSIIILVMTIRRARTLARVRGVALKMKRVVTRR